MQLVRDFCDGLFEMLGEILAAHTAIRFYTNGERQKAMIAMAITVIYLVIGIVSIWFFEGTGRDAQVAGTAMFLIAGAVYVLIALVDDAAVKQEAAEAEAARLAIEQGAEREQENAEHERQHEKDMEQMRLDHEALVAREERESQERMERYRLKRSGVAVNGRSGRGGNGRLPANQNPVQRLSKNGQVVYGNDTVDAARIGSGRISAAFPNRAFATSVNSVC